MWHFAAENFQKSNSCVYHHDRKRARPTPTLAGSGESSKLRNLQETARREVDLSLSYVEDNSTPGLNRSRRPLTCQGQHIYTCLYIYSKDDTPVKTSGRFITQLAKMSTDPKYIKLTADVFRILIIKLNRATLREQDHGWPRACGLAWGSNRNTAGERSTPPAKGHGQRAS